MIKLIVGKKGTGKTKNLIELVNSATDTAIGKVVCIEKGVKLTYDITHKARLINSEEFDINDYDNLYGFVAGVIASNYDNKDIFIDSVTKICSNEDIVHLEQFIDRVKKIVDDFEITLTITASTNIEDIPMSIREYIV